MRNTVLFSLLLIAAGHIAHATTWLVGPTRTYTAPSKVASLVQDGDTVAIDAGTYQSDVAHWTANNLVLEGVGGYAHLKANGANFGGKAIWVIGGTNTTVRWIEFSLCACPDHNGAGIRQEGVNLTVQHCNFHDNEDGILAGDNPTSTILIEYTEFNNNGFGDGYSHNLYINHEYSLIFRYNYSHHAPAGHELKSRAYRNYIMYNRLANEATGKASREIDMPNGGLAVVVGNEIEQGPMGENGNIIGYGLEGLINPVAHQVYIAYNTIVNDRGNGSFINIQDSTQTLKVYNNIFAGSGTVIVGTPTVLDTAANLTGPISKMGFVSAAGYDYHLLSTSPARTGGGHTGPDSLSSISPDHEYVHPTGSTARAHGSSIAIGAHELAGASSVAISEDGAGVVMAIYPNPFSASAVITIAGIADKCSVIIYNVSGEQVRSMPVTAGRDIAIGRDAFPAGTYYAVLLRDGNRIAEPLKFVVR